MRRRYLARMAALASLTLCAGSLLSAGLAAAAPADLSRPALVGGTWGKAQ